MTTLLDPSPAPVTPWSVMPGWGVVADLTPPELVELRRVRVLRKLIGISLAVVLALCVGGYVLAMFHESSAQDALSSTQNDGVSLSVDGHKYAAVTQVQAATLSVDGQIAQLMTDDVDVAGLLQHLRQAVPNTMSLTSVNVSLSDGSATSGVTTPGTTTTTPSPLDSTANVIGSVTLSGSSANLRDLATFVDALQAMRGVTAVLPANNTAGAKGVASWSVTLSLTDKLYTHKYVVTAKTTGGK